MADDWKLTLEDFGRIARAEVEVKRFTVLVGPNNTGKSYLASLIWGVEGGGLGAPEVGEEAAAALAAWYGRIPEDGQAVPWTPDARRVLVDAWERHSTRSVVAMCRRLFGEDGIAPARARVDALGFARDRCLGESAHGVFVSCFLRVFEQGAFDVTAPGVPEGIVADLSGSSGAGLSPTYGSDWDALFLPASRTGLSLFMPVAGAADLRLTLPYRHLIDGLRMAFGGETGPFADEAGRLERSLGGRIVAVGGRGAAVYRFVPDGSAQPIGLHLASAAVTELMPLVIALRYARNLSFLVVEAPETHLHLRMQRAVTRCLARLVRRGVRVLITTHGTTVAQQVNNLVKLGMLEPDRRRAFERDGYGPDDYLIEGEVAVHQCVPDDDGRAVITPVEPVVGGFPMPTFNASLMDVSSETSRLYVALDPDGEDAGGLRHDQDAGRALDG